MKGKVKKLFTRARSDLEPVSVPQATQFSTPGQKVKRLVTLTLKPYYQVLALKYRPLRQEPENKPVKVRC